eukprot:552824-Rhodomonas_salina.1
MSRSQTREEEAEEGKGRGEGGEEERRSFSDVGPPHVRVTPWVTRHRHVGVRTTLWSRYPAYLVPDLELLDLVVPGSTEFLTTARQQDNLVPDLELLELVVLEALGRDLLAHDRAPDQVPVIQAQSDLPRVQGQMLQICVGTMHTLQETSDAVVRRPRQPLPSILDSSTTPPNQ